VKADVGGFTFCCALGDGGKKLKTKLTFSGDGMMKMGNFDMKNRGRQNRNFSE